MTEEWSSYVHVRMVVATFYGDIADMLLEGARRRLKEEGIEYSQVKVPGALEIPPAIQLFEHSKYRIGEEKKYPPARQTERIDDNKVFVGYVALGCVIRGETSHYDIVANESARGLMDLGLKGTAIGNGILTVNNRDQAIARADPDQGDKGGHAAEACLQLMRLAGRHLWTPR